MATVQELKSILCEGLLFLLVTDFDAQGGFRADTYAGRLEWLAPYGASALFAAGGTRELFLLTRNDHSNVVPTANETYRSKEPILAGVGGPTRVAIENAKEAERLGANGVLLMPHYLTEASQEGIAAHVEQGCKAVKNICVTGRARRAGMCSLSGNVCMALLRFTTNVRRALPRYQIRVGGKRYPIRERQPVTCPMPRLNALVA